MNFTPVFEDLKKAKLAARRYEREGHRQFRDCITVGRNARVLFQRFSWGEAASLAFEMYGTAAPSGTITWREKAQSYDAGDAAPKCLTGYEAGALEFDNTGKRWIAAADKKYWPQGGLGRLRVLLAR